MDLIKQIYLLLICQGFYLGSLCQEWRFPRKIVALLGSCVEIPCTYHPDGRSGASSIVWYVSTGGPPDLQILNTKDSSTVMEEYRDRTSLVPGNNSCTLRIDPVRGHDDNIYNPGNGEEKSIYPNIKRSGYVILYVIDRVNIQLFRSNLMTEGEATVIQCSVVHTCRSSPPSIQWNKPGQVQNQSVEIFEGSWREESNLTYIPSHMDDGTPIQCTAKHPNGRITERSQTLNINYAATEVHITTKSEGEVTRLICDFLSSRPNVTHYTWMKDGSILQNETGKTLPVDNNEGSYGQYSCIAHNMVGNSSSEGHNDEESSILFINNYGHIILPIAIGTICMLLLVLLVYAFWRKKQRRQKNTYKSEATYASLKKSEMTEIYSQLKPVTPADFAVVGSDDGATDEYVNVQRQDT